ncbi:hypothetical protein ERC79_10070 [Rhodococcus sp. ABRD24]|uniref:V-type ATP synthase subunit E family protein n=1 Tax=Rhodococcus sp. ABRD24 TaxID=2507582 RepID=UPI00103C2478|nr:V-type ATP synthase subunit E family protein [Rhodococcus sp. ABRD24]QBJ96274.1 hypothetical protein ERC79_10070 [Rhodococcus sp. ABRD24]
MTTVRTRSGDPLAPVRKALLDRARADAARIRGAADADAAALEARARTEADGLLAAARTQGEADAETVLAAERSRARRRSRTIVLEARREVYEDLHDRIREAVTALRGDAVYPALLEQLAAQARAALGPDATITEDPGGGVVGQVRGRRAVCTLDALADARFDALGVRLTRLWES